MPSFKTQPVAQVVTMVSAVGPIGTLSPFEWASDRMARAGLEAEKSAVGTTPEERVRAIYDAMRDLEPPEDDYGRSECSCRD